MFQRLLQDCGGFTNAPVPNERPDSSLKLGASCWRAPKLLSSGHDFKSLNERCLRVGTVKNNKPPILPVRGRAAWAEDGR